MFWGGRHYFLPSTVLGLARQQGQPPFGSQVFGILVFASTAVPLFTFANKSGGRGTLFWDKILPVVTG